MKNLLYLTFCYLMIFVFASSANAQTATVEFEKPFTSAKLSGIVVDQSGSPIENALVERVSSDFETHIKLTATNSRGQFTFSTVSNSLYYLKISAPGFNQLQVRVRIRKRSKSKLKFVLPIAT